MEDGEFWIDPPASGNAFKVYCDMTTDKGKKICWATRTVYVIAWAMKTTRDLFDEIDINMPPSCPGGGHMLVCPGEREAKNTGRGIC